MKGLFHKKRKWIFIFLAITAAVTIVLKLLLDVSVIRIIPTGETCAEAKGVNVQISSIIKNNHDAYDLNQIRPEGWYTLWGTNIENYGDSTHPLEIRTHRYDSLQITFFNNPYMGIVEIETSGQKYRLDLYTPNEYGTTMLDIPFSVSEEGSWRKSLGIGTVAGIVLTCFLLMFEMGRPKERIEDVSFAAGIIVALLLIKTGIKLEKRTSQLFVITYGFFMGFILPDIFAKDKKRLPEDKGSTIALLMLSVFATVCSLYSSLIKPFSSFHFGLNGAIQFVAFFVYWFLGLSTIMYMVEKYVLLGNHKTIMQQKKKRG